MSDWTPPPGGSGQQQPLPGPPVPGPPPPGPAPAPGWPTGAPGPTPGEISGAYAGYRTWTPPPQAPKPGIVALRPLGVADILDGAIAYVRREPRTVFGLSAALSLILLVLDFFSLFATFRSLGALATLGPDAPADPVLDTGGALAMLAQAVLSLPVSVIATGLLTTVVGRAVLGRTTTARVAWDTARPLFWRLLGVTLLMGLIVGGIVLGAILVAVALGLLIGQASTAAGVLVGVVIGLAGIVAAIWVGTRLALAPAVLVLERSGVVTALRRSAGLVTGSWWRVFGILLLAQVIAGVVAQVLTLPFTLVGTFLTVAFPQSGSLWWITLTAVSLGTFVATVVTMPFTAGVTALVYVDRRIRREALDIELARAGAGPR